MESLEVGKLVKYPKNEFISTTDQVHASYYGVPIYTERIYYAFPVDSSITTCPKCKNPVLTEWNYCPFCGTKLRDFPVTPAGEVIIIVQEDDGYVAYSKSFPGAVGQGETEEEALKDLEEAIKTLKEAMEMVKKNGSL